MSILKIAENLGETREHSAFWMPGAGKSVASLSAETAAQIAPSEKDNSPTPRTAKAYLRGPASSGSPG
jgi:hypothetical protein